MLYCPALEKTHLPKENGEVKVLLCLSPAPGPFTVCMCKGTLRQCERRFVEVLPSVVATC